LESWIDSCNYYLGVPDCIYIYYHQIKIANDKAREKGESEAPEKAQSQAREQTEFEQRLDAIAAKSTELMQNVQIESCTFSIAQVGIRNDMTIKVNYVNKNSKQLTTSGTKWVIDFSAYASGKEVFTRSGEGDFEPGRGENTFTSHDVPKDITALTSAFGLRFDTQELTKIYCDYK
jgi:hypothetical protein